MDVPVLLVECEGVVFETAVARRGALASALLAEGLPVTDEALDAGTGFACEESVRRARRASGAPDDETAVELGRLRAERAFMERAGKGLALATDARPALERLASHARLALVTRASRAEVEFLVALAGLEGVFRPVVTCDDVRPPKPARDAWLAALARVGQHFPGQVLRAVAVEDHVAALRAARTASIASVGVGPLPPHEAMEADLWVERLSDLTPERMRTLMTHDAERRK